MVEGLGEVGPHTGLKGQGGGAEQADVGVEVTEDDVGGLAPGGRDLECVMDESVVDLPWVACLPIDGGNVDTVIGPL